MPIAALGAVVLISLSAVDASAGVVRAPTSSAEREMGCDLVLQGEILAGDHDKLTAALKERDYTRLCLDSRGGSFKEAISLVETILAHDYPVSTAIAEHATCLSACAVVFMFGRGNAYHGGTASGEGHYLDRKLHPGGTLGFHAPGIAIPDRQYSKENVLEAWDTATETISKIIGIRSRTRYLDFFGDTVLRAMLETPSADMYYVDTVGKAAVFDIEIAPVNMPTIQVEEGARNFCRNLFSNAFGEEALAAGPEILELETHPIDPQSSEPNITFPVQPRRGTGTFVACNFRFDQGGPFSGGHFWISNSTFDTGIYFQNPRFMFYPPATRIEDLPRNITRDDIVDWLEYSTGNASVPDVQGFERASWCPDAATSSETAICNSRVLNEIEIATLLVYERVKEIAGVRQIVRDRHARREQCGADERCLESVMRETLEVLLRY